MIGTSTNLFSATLLLALSTLVNGYWLMGIKNFITTERIDPIVNPGAISGHVHSVLGGSNFGFESTTERLQNSECTSIPIVEDKSNYWFPHLYFQWANGSFSSLTGGAVIYYLFPDKPGATTAFPPNFRMLSGSPTKRSYDANNYAQQAVDYLCLDFNGVTTRHPGLPDKVCPSGIRAQINFPSCWDGKNVDAPDHKSHVAFRSEGPDKGECTDPKYPVSIPRIFIEVYWASGEWDKLRSQAMKPSQPFVFSYGDRTGYGNHADYFNGWQPGVLQKAVDGCTCDIYGDPTCCAAKGIFTLEKEKKCFITKSVDETTTGMLPKLPGNNPVQEGPGDATMFKDTVVPGRIAPVYVYSSGNPTATGKVVTPASTIAAGGATSAASSSSVSVTKPVTSSTAATSSSISSSAAVGGGATTPSSPIPTGGNVAPTSSTVATSSSSSTAAGGGATIPSSPTPTGGNVAPTSSTAATSSSSSTAAGGGATTRTTPSSSTSAGGNVPATSSTAAGGGATTPSSSTSAGGHTHPVNTSPASSSPATATTPASGSTPSSVVPTAPASTSSTSIRPPAVPPTGATTSRAVQLPAVTGPSTTRRPPSRPTKICKKKKHHHHGAHHHRASHVRRYDFDVDDYYQMV